MCKKVNEFNLLEYRGTKSSAFTGRPQGELARKKLKLDDFDKHNDVVKLIIPKGTRSFHPSFYLGLLFESITNLKPEGFQNMYTIIHEDENSPYKAIIDKNIDFAWRHALNSLKDSKSLKGFFK